MSVSRRVLLTGLLLLISPTALAHPGRPGHSHRAKRRRKVRRRVRRRRIRRRVGWRLVRGRRVLVVPLGIAVGWELVVDDHIVIVKEVHTHKIVVEKTDGSVQSIDVEKGDTAENAKDLEGSDYEVEVEEEVEEED